MSISESMKKTLETDEFQRQQRMGSADRTPLIAFGKGDIDFKCISVITKDVTEVPLE